MNDLKKYFELISKKYLNNDDKIKDDYKVEKNINFNGLKEKIETEYENLVSKDKLIFMLIYGTQNNFFDSRSNVLNFIEKIKNSKVPIKISEYLYNYLYQNPEFKKIDLKFKNNKLYFLAEKFKKTLIYSVIQLDEKVGDVKVTSVKIKKHKEYFEIQKIVLFSLDSAIDLVVLNGEKKSYSYSDKNLIEVIEKILKDKNYIRMGLLIPTKPNFYDSIGLKLDNSISYLDEGILKEFNGDLKKVRKVNLSKYTKNNYGNLKKIDLNKNILNKENINYLLKNDYNDNMKVFSDKDIMYFISDLSKASIDKENSPRIK